MGELVASALPIAVLLVAVAIFVIAERHRRQRVSPSGFEQPYGKTLLVRGAPFILLSVAGCVWGIVRGDTVTALLGAIAAAALTFEVVRRWEQPD